MAERKNKNSFSRINFNSLMGLIKQGLKTKGFLYVTIGNLINAVMGGIFYLICARILSVTNYGYISYYLSIGFFVSSVSILGLNTTISTFYPKERRDDLIRETTLLTFILGFIIGLGAALFVFFFPASIGSNNIYGLQFSLQWLVGGDTDFVFILPLVLGIVVYVIAYSRALGRREYKRFFVIVISVRVMEITLVAAFYLFCAFSGYFLKDIGKLMLLAYLVPLFMVSYDYFKDLVSVRKTSFYFAEIRAKLTFTLHTWGMNLAQASRTVVDKIVVGLIFGMLFLGTYNLAFQFLVILLIIPQSLLFYLLPEKSAGTVRREVEIIGILAAVAITVLGISLSPYFIQWLFPNFTDSIPVTQVISLAVVPATVASIKASVLLSEERSKIVVIGYISALAVDLFGILLLGQSLQSVGFAIAFLLSQIVLMVILLVLPSEKFARLINRRKSAVQEERMKS
ncbi:MAG: oligosaccharide flippase family protein [Candidatus Lokiarchaeia archaeon]